MHSLDSLDLETKEKHRNRSEKQDPTSQTQALAGSWIPRHRILPVGFSSPAVPEPCGEMTDHVAVGRESGLTVYAGISTALDFYSCCAKNFTFADRCFSPENCRGSSAAGVIQSCSGIALPGKWY